MKKKDQYWDEVQENAIIDFQKASTATEKNLVYTQHLHKPIAKMAQIIMKTYFSNTVKLKDHGEEMQSNAMIIAYESLDKFQPSRNTKAFSFIQTVIKHYYYDFGRQISKQIEIGKLTSSTSPIDDDGVDNESTFWSNEIIDNEYQNESEFQDERDVNVDSLSLIDAAIYGLKKIKSKHIVYKLIIECIEKYQTLNRNFISYYVFLKSEMTVSAIRMVLHRDNKSLVLHLTRLENTVERIFKKYSVTDSQKENWKYLLKIMNDDALTYQMKCKIKTDETKTRLANRKKRITTSSVTRMVG